MSLAQQDAQLRGDDWGAPWQRKFFELRDHWLHLHPDHKLFRSERLLHRHSLSVLLPLQSRLNT